MKTARSTAVTAVILAMLSGTALADNARHQPKMVSATPLAHNVSPHNALLNISGDPGDDDTAISLDPTLSALCQSFIGKLDTFPRPRPNVDQIHDDTIGSVGSMAGCDNPQNETSIAVNPENPRNLVAGTNDYRIFNTREARNDGSGWAYTTFDGGRTWKDIELPHVTFQTGAVGALSDMDSAGDPAIAFGPRDTVYYANLVFSRLNNASGVVVSVSHDGGLRWSEPSIVHLDGVDAMGNSLPTNVFNDKEWVTVDQRTGTVYVTWTEFLSDANGHSLGSPIFVARSGDGGKSWSQPVAVNPASSFTPGGVTPFSSGSNPVVKRDGELVIAYESAVCQSLACDQASDHDAVVIATSRDGGRTFTSQEVAENFDFPGNADTGRATLTGENFRINSFPQLTRDRVTDALYVTWADDRNGAHDPTTGASTKTHGDVLLAASRDGHRWSQTFDLSGSADEVYPAVAAFGGQVAVSFYTRAFDRNGVGLDVAYASVDAEHVSELSSARIHRVTTSTSNPQIQFVGTGAVTKSVLQGVFIGDYTAVAMGTDGVLHPCWTDFRGHPGVTAPNQDAYVDAIRLDDDFDDF